MKPYGVEVIERPNVGDIRAMGAKSSAGRFPGKGGDYHPYSSGSAKARARRGWKRHARLKGKRDIQEGLYDVLNA